MLSGREIVRALERGGFRLHRTSGSHHVMRHDGPPQRTAVVPIHGTKPIPRGTLGSILRQAGLTRDAFKALL
ncbi:MAG: type II toxin-antitoxin system HicA family toxin [Pseudomonadota bacterium]